MRNKDIQLKIGYFIKTWEFLLSFSSSVNLHSLTKQSHSNISYPFFSVKEGFNVLHNLETLDTAGSISIMSENLINSLTADPNIVKLVRAQSLSLSFSLPPSSLPPSSLPRLNKRGKIPRREQVICCTNLGRTVFLKLD